MTPPTAPGRTGPPEPYFDALRDQLVEAGARRRGRRRSGPPVPLVAAAAVFTMLAATFALLAVAPRAGAGVEVRRAGDRVELRLVGDDVDGQEVERAAAKAGLRVSVTPIAVGPSRANRFVAAAAEPILPQGFARLEESTGTFRGFSVPASWPGELRLRLGQLARGNERYERASDAFADGEPLECHDVRGLQALEAARVLGEEDGLSVVWELQSPAGARRTTPAKSPAARVTAVEAVSRSEVIVLLVEGEVAAPRPAPRCGDR